MILIDNDYKKYMSQKNVQFWIKNHIFQKFNSVNVNKSTKRIGTYDLRFTIPTL